MYVYIYFRTPFFTHDWFVHTGRPLAHQGVPLLSMDFSKISRVSFLKLLFTCYLGLRLC